MPVCHTAPHARRRALYEAPSAPEVSVVIPVYNEAENLPDLYVELREVLENMCREWEAVFVDDGSTDGSFARLAELAAKDDRIKVIQLARNYGQSTAFRVGFEHARGERVVTMDADLQNDASGIPALLAKMDEGYDVVCGWRVRRQDPLLSRRLPSRVANWLISRLTGVAVHDRGCSLRAYRRDLVKELPLYGELHRFIPEMAANLGARMAEVPVGHRPRQHGRSKYGIGRTGRVIIDLMTVQFLQSYSTRPMHIFGKGGLFLSGVGVALGLWLSYLKLVQNQSIGNRPLLLLAVLLMLMGMQMISIGLLGEMIMRTYYESPGKQVYRVREIIGEAEE